MTDENLKMIKEAESLPNSSWDQIQVWIDITNCLVTKTKLERIMINKFHGEEAENDSL